jgi:hypothetical protein
MERCVVQPAADAARRAASSRLVAGRHRELSRRLARAPAPAPALRPSRSLSHVGRSNDHRSPGIGASSGRFGEREAGGRRGRLPVETPAPSSSCVPRLSLPPHTHKHKRSLITRDTRTRHVRAHAHAAQVVALRTRRETVLSPAPTTPTPSGALALRESPPHTRADSGSATRRSACAPAIHPGRQAVPLGPAAARGAKSLLLAKGERLPTFLFGRARARALGRPLEAGLARAAPEP